MMKMAGVLARTRLRSFLRFIGCWVALAFGASPVLAIDPFFPTFGNDGIDVLHYDIDLDVKPGPGRLDGKATLLIKAERNLSRFTLDLHALGVSGANINGLAVGFAQARDKLIITPRQPIPNGAVFRLKVFYSGVPDPLPDPTAPEEELSLGWFKYKDAAYVVSEPIGASTFYPANDEPDDKATFAFTVTVPKDYTGVANGVFVDSIPVDTKRSFRWAMHQPMTTWLATVHVNRFKLHEKRASNGTQNRVYEPKGGAKAHGKNYAEARKMLTHFETLIGPYPFESYGSVLVQDPVLYYALETQAMSTFPVTDPPDDALMAHELAHQWFGNSVSVAKWEDLWLAEGSATYFELLWPNRKDSAKFNQAMFELYDYVVDQKLGPAVVEAPDQLFSDRTYYRGAAALFALRLKVGESRFFNILRHFMQDNKGGNVTSADFIRTAVRYSGDATVRPLLHAWLYEKEVPPLPGRMRAITKPGSVPRPDIVGGRCGRGSHRGSQAKCKASAGAAP